MRPRPRLLLASVAALALACGGARPSSETPRGPGVAPPPAHPRLQVIGATDRPAVARVSRTGDPYAAVAIAIAHDSGSTVSAALAGLLEARLSRVAAGVLTRPHDLGVVVSALVKDAAEAERFTRAALAALTQDVATAEPAVALAQRKLSALTEVSRALTPSDPVQKCSGELAPDASKPAASTIDAAALERMRASVARAQGVSVGALGSDAVLDAVTRAVQAGPPWPEGGPEDPWPAGDQVVSAAPGAARPTLSVALRIDDGARAISAARHLGRRGSERLAARLSSVTSDLRIERVAATTRPRGACLRVDLTSSNRDAMDGQTAAWAAWAVEQEALAAAASGGAWWDIEDGVLRAADPREAASVAAWRALSGRLVAAEPRRFVRAAVSDGAALDAELARVRQLSQSPLELRSRPEAGQGHFWMLLASPCGVKGESETDAGLTAAMLTAASMAANERHDDVMFEPWIEVDSVGLVAHGPRSGPRESEDEHARRVADALGWALAGTPIDSSAAAGARANLGQMLPKEGRTLWRALVSATSPERPSWLQPFGDAAALLGLSGHAIDARRRTFLSEPLRVAVLASGSAGQPRVAQETLTRWVLPARTHAVGCPRANRRSGKTGEVELDGSEPGHALVSVALPRGASAEAQWLRFLLNRSGGMLDRALQGTRLGRAQASVLGGAQEGALVIELRTFADVEKDAIAQTRALLTRLAAGALTSADFEAARRHFEAEARERSLDPRQRLTDTWSGQRAAAPTLSGLRSFCQQNLGATRHLVVRGKSP
ncbi:MAG: hypothetical protein R3B13_39145 [Polyangiaceae bacterium]